MSDYANEQERVDSVYSERKANEEISSRYSMLNTDVFMYTQEKKRATLKLLKKAGINRINISQKKFLEIGAGGGTNILDFIGFGIEPQNVTYNEIIDRGLDQIKKRLPDDIKYIMCDATEFDSLYNNSFDIIYISTVFSSILDEGIREALGKKAMEMLSEGGLIIFYDFCFDNPKNPDVKKVTAKQVEKYFQGEKVFSKKITLAPPIARKFANFFSNSFAWYNIINLPFVRTHRLIAIRKQG